MKAKNVVNSNTIKDIASGLNVYHKGTVFIDSNMQNKAGNNENVKITEIDQFFTTYIDKEDLRKQAYNYAMNTYKNKTVMIKDIQENIDIPQSGIKKTFGKNQDNIKMQTANNLLDIIQNSIYLNSSQSTNNSNILYHYFYSPISINNTNGIAMVTIKEDITNKQENNKFYYHDIRQIKNIEKANVHAMPRNNTSNMLFEQSPSTINTSIAQNDNSVKLNNTSANSYMQNNKSNTKIDSKTLKRVNDTNVRSEKTTKSNRDNLSRVADDSKTLIAQHNTTEAKLLEALDLGALPAPSIAITKAGTPITNYGDITLLFNKDTISPTNKQNATYNSDIYSTRKPQVVYTLDKAKANTFESIAKQNGISSSYTNMIEEYIQNNDFDRAKEIIKYELEKSNDSVITQEVEDIFTSAMEMIDQKRIIKDGVDPYKADGTRKTITQMSVEYNLDNILRYMTKKNTQGSENGMFTGIAEVRANMATRFKSIEEMHKAEGNLVSNEEMAEIKENLQNDFYNLSEKIGKYDTVERYFGSADTVANALNEVAKSKNITTDVLENELDYVSIRNVPQETLQEAVDFLNSLKNAPTEYFESKPQRAVDFSEVKKAIVPKGTSQELVNKLVKKGIDVSFYENETQRKSMITEKSSDIRFMKNVQKVAKIPLKNVQKVAKIPLKNVQKVAKNTRENVRGYDNQGRALTQEQQNFFKDSKARDKNGNLITMYHLTDSKFNIIDFKKSSQGLFWFTSSKEALESGEISAAGTRNKLNAEFKELYVNMKNPATYEQYDRLTIGQLKSKGYDGVLWEEDGVYIGFVFNNSNQIKNVTNTTPTTSDDIRYMKKNTKAKTDVEIRDIVRYNPDGREIKDNDYVDFMVKRYKDNKNISSIETDTKYVESLRDNEPQMLNTLYNQIKEKAFTTKKTLINEDGASENVVIDLRITKQGIKESVNKSISNEKLAVIPYLDTLVQTSQDGIIRGETKNRRNILQWYYLYNTAKINDKLYSVKIDLKKTQTGDRFYVHRVNIIQNEGDINTVPGFEHATKSNSISPSINISIAQSDNNVKSSDTSANNSMQNDENNTKIDSRTLKRVRQNNELNNVKWVENDTVERKPPNITPEADEASKTNAEGADRYIEQEIKKIEQTASWDNSIPVTKRTDIKTVIEDYLGNSIKRGKFRERAYGIYKSNRDVIRVQEYKDIDNILHETGHALDLGNRISINKADISEELFKAVDKHGGYEDESTSVRLDEGFAEVVREYAIVPEQAKIEYPQTVAVLEGIRKTDTSFDQFIGKVQKMTYNYIHQNPRNRVLSNQSIGKQNNTKIDKERIKTEIMRNVWDSDYSTKKVVNDLAQGKKIKASDNAYFLTRLASGIQTKTENMLKDGYINLDGKKIMPGLSQLGDILGDNPERYNDLRVYLVAMRDTDYKAKSLKTGIRSMDTKAVIEQFKNDTQIQEAAKVVYDTLDGVMQYAVENGLITEDTAKNLKESNAFYVPMQRDLDSNSNKTGRRGAVKDIIKRRTGSELDINDVLENIVTNSANVIQQVENNNILKALYREGENSGIKGTVYDVISTPMKKIGTAQLSTWKAELQRQGVDVNNIDFEKTIDLFAPNTKVDTQNLITSFINDNGNRVYLQFNDELLFNSLMGADKKFMSTVLKINSVLNQPLRYGATMANIGFAIPNMISDTAQAAIYSEAGFIPVVDNAIGVLEVLSTKYKPVANFLNKVAPDYAKRINTMYTLYTQSGADSSTRLSQYGHTKPEIMKDIYGVKNSETLGIDEKFKPLKRMLDIMTCIPEISEQSTRFRVFEKNYSHYLSKGNSDMDARIMAALESRDATQDFGRTGNITREINQLVPFSAARVGSGYTFAEKIKANPKKVGTRIAVMVAISMLIKGIGYDDKEIEELNQRKKDDNFVFKVGDTVMTLKKPQGILRSIINLAEYIQDLATGHIESGKEVERLGEWVTNAIMDNMPADEVTGLVPNAVSPLIENAINKDFYYNTDIVKSYDLDLPDYQQYYDYNSQLAIWLGKIFNYSPAKIDNLISGYFGGLGTQFTNIIDWVSGKLGLSAEEPNMGIEDNAIGKRFVVNVNENSSSIDEIYDRKTELTKKQNGGTITSEEEEELETIKSAINSISKLNKQIKSIKADLTMSGEEKAEAIKPLQEQKTDTARQALGKELIYSENAEKIEATKFYPTNNTLSLNGYKLELTDDMKEEYEEIAYEQYSKYAKQGLYSDEYLETLETKCKEYAKKSIMSKYRSQLTKSK